MSGSGAPQPRMQPESLQPSQLEPFQFMFPPDTAGMLRLKLRKPTKPSPQPFTERFIRPRQPTQARFPIVLTPSGIQPGLPGQIIAQQGIKRKAEIELHKSPLHHKKTVRCPKCGEYREPPTHQQYMGYRYCGKTETVPFDQWRANLQALGVARKKKN